MKPGKIVLLVVIAIFLVALGINFSQNASVYTDFASAKASQKSVHVVGEWVDREQANFDAEKVLFTFYLQDTTQNVELVHLYEPKPNNFEQAEKVVVVGGYKGDKFIADKIVMKCPSKYEENTLANEAAMQ